MKNKGDDVTLQAPMLLLSELLYEDAPKISAAQIRDQLVTILPNAKVVSKTDDGTVFLIAHEDCPIEYKGGQKVPAQTVIMRGNPVKIDRLATALSQTWDWPEARGVVQRAKHQLAVTEMMATLLEPQVRVNLFYNVLLRLLEIAPPLAVHCHHAERIVDPAKIVRASGSPNPAQRMSAFLNVRLFRIENAQASDTLMDTRGLAALGLPDLQIHFRGLEPGRVAAHLLDCASYIYSNGDCIKDGHTIQGLDPTQKWRCQHETSLTPPKRLVIDLDPGDPFAAGQRHR